MKIFKVSAVGIGVLTFFASVVAIGQSLSVYPTAPIAPRGSYQTVTAIVSGVNDKTVKWTTDGGTIVGTNPCVVNEPCTVALYTTTAGTYHLTATSNANGAVTAISTVTFTGSPTPVATHPRLGGITASMLPGLRAKAVPGNPLYMALRNTAIAAYNSDNAVFSWSCNAGTGLPSSDQTENYLEQHAYLYAFMSLMAPSDPTYKWGCYARDIWMYTVNFWLDPLNSSYSPTTLTQRHTDAQYGLTGNHASDSTESLTLTPDWLMAGGYLSPSDLTTTRAYFALAANQVISIRLTGNVGVVGNYNSSSQFNSGSVYDFVGQRAMGNNYTHSKILYQTAAALTFNDDATDDPPMPNTCNASRYVVCADGTAGSLHAYFTYLTGAMLYKDWAHMEDPNVSWPAYQAAYANLPAKPTCEDSTDGSQVPCFGDGRSGESSEGSWYQYSMYRLQLAMLSIKSAGYADPMVYGPQMSLATSSWWDLKAVSDLSFLTYSYYTPQPRWAYFSTGDTLQLYRAPTDFNYAAWMLVGDSIAGRSDRTARLEWPLLYTSIGGISSFFNNLGNGYGYSNAIPMFIALPSGDPTSVPPADPRPSLPTDLFSGNNQHILVRSGWDANGPQSAKMGTPGANGKNVVFSSSCQNSRIDHEHETCGGFDILSGGEFITKQRTVFNNYNMMLATAEFSNIAGYLADPAQTACTAAGSCWQWQAAQGYDTFGGGQMWHGQQAGSATLNHSELPAYVGFGVDTTNLYNASAAIGWGALQGVTQASRSLVYLRGTNQVVYYDRGASTGAWNKRLWVTTTGPLTIAGNVASWPTRSGSQKAYVTSLLPSGATLSDAGAYQTIENNPGTSDWEPYSNLQIDAGKPQTTQFLSVLEWGNSASAQSTTSLVQSTSGQTFDGALTGSSLVMFMRAWPATFTGVTYPASGATTQYVSDLTPNTSYAISAPGAPATATTDSAGVLTFTATGKGNITVGVGSTPHLESMTISPSTVSLQALNDQQYSATCSYSDGSNSDCTSEIDWKSSAIGVVTINPSGMATGVAQGDANIVASNGSIQALAAVTVPAATLQSIEVTPGTPTVSRGSTQQFKATGTYSNSSTTDLTAKATWKSSDVTVASATSSGLATAMAPGNANIIASSGAIQGQTAVTVTSDAPTFSPSPGMYTSAQTVTIRTTAPSATIYYTTDGSSPTTSSTVYSAPITVAATETIRAVTATVSTRSMEGSATYSIAPPMPAPSFSPAAGTYTSVQTVAISTAGPSATIYYTTNGSTPTTSSTVYSGPIMVSASETIKAIAIAASYSNSAVGLAAYTITQTAATPTFSPAPGTYTSTQTVSISTATPSATIYYTTNGSTPTTSSTVYSGPIMVSASETVKAIAIATSYSNSAVGSSNYTITPVAATPTFSPAAGTYTSAQTISISTAAPSAAIYYTTNGSAPTTSSTVYSGPIMVSASETVKAIATATNYSNSTVGLATYTITQTAATPTFSPAPGTYTSSQTVSIASTTPLATIHFTTDRSRPTSNSPVYSGPITISATATIKAIAVLTGYLTNAVGSADYVITPPAATPSFNPEAGTYTSIQTVTISTTTNSTTLHFTTDGTAPTASSTLYSGPITVAATETIRAIAVPRGHSNNQGAATASSSDTGWAVYTINLPAAATPAFSLAAGTYTSAQRVTISTTTPSATIHFTTDGSPATASSHVYSGAIMVSTSETVRAITVAIGRPTSEEGTATYMIIPMVAIPTFMPVAGTYTSAQTVTISTTTPLTTIRYTTNGSTPTTNSPVYSVPITVASTETVNAIAIVSGYGGSLSSKNASSSISVVGSASYIMNPPRRTFSVVLSPASINVPLGKSGNTMVSVIPQNGFDSPVTFTCAGLPSGATCNFAPATVTPSGDAASTTLTVTTSNRIAALPGDSRPFFPGSSLAVAFCCFGLKRRRGLQMLLLAGVTAEVSLCTGCGSDVSSISSNMSTVAVIASNGFLQPATSFTLTLQ